MKNYKIEVTVFVSGAVIMMMEMSGSRVFAPYLGSSTFVWTALIGIILGCLSLGYFLGGRYADKKASFSRYSNLFLIAAALILLTTIFKNPVLSWTTGITKDIRLGAVIATIILFAAPSVILGMISPYALRLKIKNIKTSGQTAGNLYALSTIGSIVGTFLAGFFLISIMGHTNLLLALAITLTLNSILADYKKNISTKLITIALICGFLLYTQNTEASDKITLDSNYSHIQIFEESYKKNQRPIKRLVRNTNHSSAMYMDTENPELVFKYTKFYDLAEHFVPELKSALMIGGGAYSYPKHFLSKFPAATLDVVEIDPKLFEIAKDHFNLQPNERFQNFAEDGRTFLNRNAKNGKKYDVIFMDAFGGDLGIPHQLTTIEAAQKMHQSLNEEGLMIGNLISALEGEKSQMLRAEYHTLKKVFPQVYVIPVHTPSQTSIVQNQIIIALKSEKEPQWSSPNRYYNIYLSQRYRKEIPNDLPPLTDDFAPIDDYIMKML